MRGAIAKCVEHHISRVVRLDERAIVGDPHESGSAAAMGRVRTGIGMRARDEKVSDAAIQVRCSTVSATPLITSPTVPAAASSGTKISRWMYCWQLCLTVKNRCSILFTG
jgi:hypothetical protein